MVPAANEALYVEGKNDGKVIAHSTGLLASLAGTVRAEPTDSTVMADNRYPITNIGMKNLMLKFQGEGEKYKDDLKFVTYSIAPDRDVDDRPCKVLEIWNSRPDKYPRAAARLYIDREWNVPTGFESFEQRDGKLVLVEYYRYTKVKFNPGFKEADFDPKNPAYKF